MRMKDLRLTSADGSTTSPIRCQPVSFARGLATWNSPPGSGCSPLWPRLCFSDDLPESFRAVPPRIWRVTSGFICRNKRRVSSTRSNYEQGHFI